METVQYKGYTIAIKHYEAFRHCHREHLEIFDYIIFEGKERVYKGYDYSTSKDATMAAKMRINLWHWGHFSGIG